MDHCTKIKYDSYWDSLMHLFEEEINLFIGCSGGLADSSPIRYISEHSRCAESRRSPDVKNYLCFLTDLQLLCVWVMFILGRKGFHSSK